MSNDIGDWRLRGACGDEDPDIFFPVSLNTSKGQKDQEAAKLICKSCVVIEECKEWAINTKQPHGVLGGMGEEERDRIVRKISRFSSSVTR